MGAEAPIHSMPATSAFSFPKAILYSPKLSTQAATSSSVAPAAKRSPSSHSPVPAKPARFTPVLPIGDDPEVQNGMTVLPEKSFSTMKSSMTQEACPHQMG